MNGDFLNLITRRGTFRTGKYGGLFRILQRGRTNRICFYLSKSVYERGGNREMDLEELAHTIVEAWKDQNPSKGRLAGWSLKEEFQAKFKGSLLAEFFLALGRSLFVLLRPSTDLLRPTHTMEENLLYSESIDLNVNLIKK